MNHQAPLLLDAIAWGRSRSYAFAISFSLGLANVA
jgi:hypothetical protein